jgi:anti-sigma B factor antagonist
MKVERKRWENVTILSFVGEFDAFNLPTYSQKIDGLVEGGEVQMVFNLRLLTFINSSALGYLLKVKKRCQELGGDLVLVQPSKFIKKTLLTLGLQEVFAIYETDEDGALSYLRPSGAKKGAIKKGDAETDEKLLGSNAVMFLVVDEEGKPLYGNNPQVGRITNLTETALELKWEVPPPGPKHLVPVSTENFDSALHPGTRLKVKFRQPFAMKSHYFELHGLVSKCDRGEGENPNEAAIGVDYKDMKPEDRSALVGYVQDMRKFKEILKQGGEAV